jgi:hypothetical protein
MDAPVLSLRPPADLDVVEAWQGRVDGIDPARHIPQSEDAVSTVELFRQQSSDYRRVQRLEDMPLSQQHWRRLVLEEQVRLHTVPHVLHSTVLVLVAAVLVCSTIAEHMLVCIGLQQKMLIHVSDTWSPCGYFAAYMTECFEAQLTHSAQCST